MSDTNTFHITYASGVQDVTTSTCQSVEEFCNEHFGSTWEGAKENGASVVMNPQGDPLQAVLTDAEREEAQAALDREQRVLVGNGATATATDPLPE